jgi:ABC-type oligopeptide transport system ATPase subunit
MEKILKVRNLIVEYTKGTKTIKALNSINFDIFHGEKIGIVGESGSGKSTLAKGILNLEKTRGQIYFENNLINNNFINFRKINKQIYINLDFMKFSFMKLLKIFDREISLKIYSEHLITKINANFDEFLNLVNKIFDLYIDLINTYKDLKISSNEITKIFSYKQNILSILECAYNLRLILDKASKNKNIVNSQKEITKNLQKITDIILLLKNDLKIFKVTKNKLTHSQKRMLKKDMQIVFQDPSLSLNERMSIKDIIGEGICNFKKELLNNNSSYKEQIHKQILNILKEVALPEKILSRYANEMSGGQKQRVSIARSVIMKPKFLIADEAISSLDVTIRAQILNLLNKFKKELNLTIMFIAHDLSIVKYFCDKIIVIYRGNIVEMASADELFKNPIHPYTQNLLNSAPLKDKDLILNKKIEEYNNDDKIYKFYPREFSEVSKNH